MSITVVYDTSEAMELCASQQLYLKPIVKLAINVVLPEDTGSHWVFPQLEVINKLKKLVLPYQFTSVKVSKSTKGFILFEAEAESKLLVCRLKEKLHGKMIKVNGFKDDLQVVATESPFYFLTPEELEPNLNTRDFSEEDLEQSQDSPDCIHLEGLPCKWFAAKGSDSKSPSEDVLRAVFEKFGKIKNIYIPMLDPYRAGVEGESMNDFTFHCLRTFEAFVQYQESTSFSKAMETLKGMKLMFKRDNGKGLACNIKVTSDTYFSGSAEIERNLERLTLQKPESVQKGEEDRGPERKRRNDDDNEKKAGEGKRKYKIKSPGERQIDKDETRLRKKQKVTNAEEESLENMPNWEERKCVLAQRRVESKRLLSALLNNVKDAVVASKQIEKTLLDLENKRKDCSPTFQIPNSPKEQVDSNCPGQQEPKYKRESKCQSTQLADAYIEEEEQYFPTDLSASPNPIGRNVLNKPVARTITSYLTDSNTNCYYACNLLEATATQDHVAVKLSNRGDYSGPNVGCFSEASSAGNRKKLKIYETDEYIHYLLNYYQPPRYARVCPGLHDPVDMSLWQRVVYYNGNNLQINLKKKEGQHMTGVSWVPNTQEKRYRGGDNWEVTDEGAEVMPKSQAQFARNSRVWRGDLSDEAEEGMLHGEMNSPVLVSTSHDRKFQVEDTEMKAMASHKPIGHVHKWKDLLEEISSDSEYLSEALNESRRKKKRKNGGCRSGCKVWPLSQQRARELLICVQNVACGDQERKYCSRSFCTNSECCDSVKYSKQNLRTPCSRTSSKASPEVQRVKLASSVEEPGRKKKRSSGNALYDEQPQFFKANHCGELESLDKMPRKYSKRLHHKMKCKTPQTVPAAVKAKYATRLGGSPFQEAERKVDKGNADIHKTGENGCEIDGKQSACEGNMETSVSWQLREVEGW